VRYSIRACFSILKCSGNLIRKLNWAAIRLSRYLLTKYNVIKCSLSLPTMALLCYFTLFYFYFCPLFYLYVIMCFIHVWVCLHVLLLMTEDMSTHQPKAHDRRTRNSCELILARNSYVCHTDLQQDISRASFSHQIERVLFRASFSYEFLVRLSWA